MDLGHPKLAGNSLTFWRILKWRMRGSHCLAHSPALTYHLQEIRPCQIPWVARIWAPQQMEYAWNILEHIYLSKYIYIYNQPRYLRISVFPIMQLNSNATPLRICPHFVLICFLPIWPLLWKPLYTSMQPVSVFFKQFSHTNLIFYYFVFWKVDFFLPQRVPPTNGGDPWEMV